MLVAPMKFNLSWRKFPTNRSKNRMEVTLCFLVSLVGVTKIKCDHDSLEVE